MWEDFKWLIGLLFVIPMGWLYKNQAEQSKEIDKLRSDLHSKFVTKSDMVDVLRQINDNSAYTRERIDRLYDYLVEGTKKGPG